jgi:hypothetical protein
VVEEVVVVVEEVVAEVAVGMVAQGMVLDMDQGTGLDMGLVLGKVKAVVVE